MDWSGFPDRKHTSSWVKSFIPRMILPHLVSHQREVQIRHLTQRVLLTAQFDPNEVSDAQVLQEDSWGWGGFKQKGDVCTQFAVKGGEVEVRCLLVEKCSVPDIFCKLCKAVHHEVLVLQLWSRCICACFSFCKSSRTFPLKCCTVVTPDTNTHTSRHLGDTYRWQGDAGLTVSMATEMSQSVGTFRASPLDITEHQISDREGLLMSHQAWVISPEGRGGMKKQERREEKRRWRRGLFYE